MAQSRASAVQRALQQSDIVLTILRLSLSSLCEELGGTDPSFFIPTLASWQNDGYYKKFLFSGVSKSHKAAIRIIRTFSCVSTAWNRAVTEIPGYWASWGGFVPVRAHSDLRLDPSEVFRNTTRGTCCGGDGQLCMSECEAKAKDISRFRTYLTAAVPHNVDLPTNRSIGGVPLPWLNAAHHSVCDITPPTPPPGTVLDLVTVTDGEEANFDANGDLVGTAELYIAYKYMVTTLTTPAPGAQGRAAEELGLCSLIREFAPSAQPGSMRWEVRVYEPQFAPPQGRDLRPDGIYSLLLRDLPSNYPIPDILKSAASLSRMGDGYGDDRWRPPVGKPKQFATYCCELFAAIIQGVLDRIESDWEMLRSIATYERTHGLLASTNWRDEPMRTRPFFYEVYPLEKSDLARHEDLPLCIRSSDVEVGSLRFSNDAGVGARTITALASSLEQVKGPYRLDVYARSMPDELLPTAWRAFQDVHELRLQNMVLAPRVLDEFLTPGKGSLKILHLENLGLTDAQCARVARKFIEKQNARDPVTCAFYDRPAHASLLHCGAGEKTHRAILDQPAGAKMSFLLRGGRGHTELYRRRHWMRWTPNVSRDFPDDAHAPALDDFLRCWLSKYEDLACQLLAALRRYVRDFFGPGDRLPPRRAARLRGRPDPSMGLDCVKECLRTALVTIASLAPRQPRNKRETLQDMVKQQLSGSAGMWLPGGDCRALASLAKSGESLDDCQLGSAKYSIHELFPWDTAVSEPTVTVVVEDPEL